MSAFAYIPADDWGRVCDVCGRLRPGKGFRVVADRWICDRHPSYVPREVLDRVPYVELGAPQPIPSAKPWNPTDTYEIAEAQILQLMSYTPAFTLDVTVGEPNPIGVALQAATNPALYLYGLIAEGRRPARWITFAEGVLRTAADFMVANQRSGPYVAGSSSADFGWGGYLITPGSGVEDYFVSDACSAGLALLRAYQVLGDQKYLDAARACAWFVRGAQCGDKLVSRPSSTDAAGASAHHYGMWPNRVRFNAGTYDFDHRYYPGNFGPGLDFLTAYLAVVGDEVIGSSAITSVFAASREALVSTAIAEARAFWANGVASVDDGAVINGLSTTTPREFFDAYPANKGFFTGRGSWQFNDGPLATGTNILGIGWASAIRALWNVGDPLATTLFDWLMTFASNPAFEASTVSHTYGQVAFTSANERAKWAGIAGTYDPRLSLCTRLKVRTSAGAVSLMNDTSFYSLATAGILAPLYSARQQSSFGRLKDALSIPRPRWREGFDPRDGQYLYLGPLGFCGLSFQPYTDTAFNRRRSLSAASLTGGVYRYAPQAYTGREAGAR